MCACVQQWVKALSGSCAVWMFRPLSAACQDDASFVRYPVFHECERNGLKLWLCMCVCVCSSEWKPWVGLVLSGCFVRCQQPVKMMRLSSGTPCFVSVSVTAWNCDCVCVCVCAVVSESLKWVLCCLDVSSVVSSLSRWCVFRQVPRVSWVWA